MMKAKNKPTRRRKVQQKESPRSVAVFPGSFDPLTNGHVDIIERALKIFDRVVIGVLDNPAKQGLLSAPERVDLIAAQFSRQRGKVEVQSFSGLLVEFAQKVGAQVIIRGLRAISDFDYEAQMALVNRNLAPSVETFFLTAREEHSYISSTVVKQVALLGGDVSTMVPGVVARALHQKYLEKRKQKPLIGPM